MMRPLLFALILAGCRVQCGGGAPPAPVTSVVDVGDAGPLACSGDVYDCACANLHRFSCPDGALPFCADSMRRSMADGVNVHAPELAAATSKEAIRAVGSYPGHPTGFVECP